MLLDTRNYPQMNFQPFTFGGTRKGTFGIQSTDYSKYKSSTLVIRGIQIPLTPFVKRAKLQTRTDGGSLTTMAEKFGFSTLGR